MNHRICVSCGGDFTTEGGDRICRQCRFEACAKACGRPIDDDVVASWFEEEESECHE